MFRSLASHFNFIVVNVNARARLIHICLVLFLGLTACDLSMVMFQHPKTVIKDCSPESDYARRIQPGVHDWINSWDRCLLVLGQIESIYRVENCSCFDAMRHHRSENGFRELRCDALYLQYLSHVYHVAVAKSERSKIGQHMERLGLLRKSLDIC
jgi:hypothetical protein